MIGKANSRQQPTALGSLTAASVYGLAIPNIYGLCKTSPLAIWAQNLRQGGSGKKFKNKKKGITAYVENIDFLLGHNPIVGVMQFWQNTTKLPLNFAKFSTSWPVVGVHSVTISVTPPSIFYSVVAVTYTMSYSVTFNDYLGPGSQSSSGTFEYPLWNVNINGPDPTNSSRYTQYPFLYDWVPADGHAVNFPIGALGDIPVGVSAVNIYYAATHSAIKYVTPAVRERITFEPTLALGGTEYVGNIIGTSTPLSSQQVPMPPFAGMGSPNLDLGSGGVIPDTRVEVQGSYGVYPSGDADFADMIEDVVKSGVAQVNPSDSTAVTPVTPVQHGASMCDYPGALNKNYSHYAPGLGGPTSLPFLQPNQVGNILINWFSNSGGSPITSDTDVLGNTWNNLDNGTFDSIYQWLLAYAVVTTGGPGNAVSPQCSGAYGNQRQLLLSEFPVDTFDNNTGQTLTSATKTNCSLTTTNALGLPAIVVAFTFHESGANITNFDPRWQQFMADQYAAGQIMVVWGPTTVNLQNTFAIGTDGRVAMAAFKQVAPLSYPKPFGNIIDLDSMNACRTQARAYGLYGSVSLQQQKAVRDYIEQWYEDMNAAPFFSEGLLKQRPRGEVSAVGNGAVYTALQAAASIPALSDLNGDFLGDANKTPVTISRQSQLDVPAILQMQIANRSSDYNPVVVSEPEAGTLAQFGVRKEAPQMRSEITDSTIARILLGIQVRRRAFIRNIASFQRGARGLLDEPMDVLTITETKSALNAAPFRYTQTTIKPDFSIDCQAEPYVYGVHSPYPITDATIVPFQPNTTGDPGNVNTPVLFEPVPRMYGAASQAQLWGVISAPSINYAGCFAYVSTDGGNSFNPVDNLVTGNSSVMGNGITGVSTADWPIASDPDTTNDLPLDLTESLGALSSYLAADRDAFTFPCYIANGSAGVPYGLLTYNSAVLTAANKYTLKATGAGNELRRCVFGAPVAAPGPDVDHPNGSRFAFLGNPAQPNPPGLMKLTMDPTWIGKTLQFKFLPFNQFGNVVEDLSACIAYSFTPTGIPGGGIAQNQNNYTQTPAIALSQPSGTQISMAAVSEQFSSNTVKYNARTFTITNPSVPTTYYVTVADSAYAGDVGSGTTLTATCQTSSALVGVPGNTYIGLIIAVPGGGSGATPGPGGWPAPQSALVVP